MNDIVLEFKLSELNDSMTAELDDLLVVEKLESPRKMQVKGGGHAGMMGMIVVVKEPPRVNVKIEVYPNETEEPHFKVTYQNVTCRFKISDCTPMKAEAKNGIPVQIKKIMKPIKTIWKNNKNDIIQAWVETRPSLQNHGHQQVR